MARNIPDALAEVERMMDVGAVGSGVVAMAALSIARDTREMLRMMQGEHDKEDDVIVSGVLQVEPKQPAKAQPKKGTGRGRQS